MLKYTPCQYIALTNSYFYCLAANHRFSSEEVDWGFTRFYDRDDLGLVSSTGKGPFLVDNEIVISVYVRIVKDETGVLWHNFVNYDSRKETGYVGIKNQGATCYMNSLLQSLYCTNKFRKAVYEIPTENDEPTKSVALALQRCFYNLQYSSSPIGTTELTKSFGWDSLDAFMQHDVQEFNRVLQDNLEEKMKGTPADGAISKLFEGKMKSYIKCINVDFESSRVEDYYDIQLNVKGCRKLTDSFEDYITVETLEGDNKYMAEGHGLQDANKGVIFESFPPVLHLQLKRFEYDFMRDTMVKVNIIKLIKYLFYKQFLILYCFRSMTDMNSLPRSIWTSIAQLLIRMVLMTMNFTGKLIFLLQKTCILTSFYSVLVHSGDISGGHYFALIRPEANDKW
jgi:ubiquitin carboxyl-terminal hydrolase 7